MKRIEMIIATVWITVMVVLSGITVWGLLYDKWKSSGSPRGEGVQAKVHKLLLDGCVFRDEMIHLYGGWARVTGRSVCNGIHRTAEGVLINSKMPYVDTMSTAKKLRTLHNVLKKQNKKLLYVQVPLKMDSGTKMLPRGWARDFSHAFVDEFLNTLRDFGISYIDVRSMLDATPADVKLNFFKTDHHWNFDGAFKAYPIIAKGIAKESGCYSPAIESYLSKSRWARKKLPRKFMGSDGRRTGRFFSGTDDIFYYVPRFNTDITKEIISKNILLNGSFEDSVINLTLAQNPTSMFLDNGYGIYGGDIDHVRYTNPHAPARKRLLIVKDSYAIPIVSWMSVVFERIDVVDLRLFKRMTLVEAVRAFDPDVVAIMYNPGAVVTGRMWAFGKCDSIYERTGLLFQARDISISASTHPYHHVEYEDVMGGAIYKVKAKSVKITSGTADKITIGLLDKKTGKAVARTTVPLGSVEWVVDVPDGKHGYTVILYAGEAGKCAGVGIVWNAVELSRIR